MNIAIFTHVLKPGFRTGTKPKTENIISDAKKTEFGFNTVIFKGIKIENDANKIILTEQKLN